ncbi:MAG: orotidine-5'-phosphate decarboxylase [Succinivibrionaceae bacterium]
MNGIDPKVIVALDFDEQKKAEALVEKLRPDLCRLKIGKEMFTRFGPILVKKFQDQGFDIFLDLKFHDIPNTVAKAVASAADLGVWMVNVHALGGPKMLEAAAKSISMFGQKRPLLTAVTVLTSMDQEQLSAIGIETPIKDQVYRLASLAANTGLDGVVCSAQEAVMLREHFCEPFKLVTPGIRPKGADVGDQVRIVTPKDAIVNGSSYLVIGRPITQAEDPIKVLTEINQDINF